jgi:hypothetical protein
MDMTPTLAAKSNRLTADDLIAGPLTITVTKLTPGSAPQEVIFNFDGDQGKPWHPCKTMRRVLAEVWGTDGLQYVGRQITLFRNPEVLYSGQKVGGIQISHLSNLKGPFQTTISLARGKRTPYRVEPLTTPAPATVAPPPDPATAALAVCHAAGLTDLGLAAFCDLAAGHSTASTLAQLPPETLARIVESGISPETVAKCNTPPAAEPEPEPAATAEDLPTAWS